MWLLGLSYGLARPCQSKGRWAIPSSHVVSQIFEVSDLGVSEFWNLKFLECQTVGFADFGIRRLLDSQSFGLSDSWPEGSIGPACT